MRLAIIDTLGLCYDGTTLEKRGLGGSESAVILISKELATNLSLINPEIISQTEIVLKYEGYIEREEDVAKKMNRMEHLSIPNDIDYSVMLSLSTEARQKLSKVLPVTIGQASRVSGVSPSDIAVLIIHLGR